MIQVTSKYIDIWYNRTVEIYEKGKLCSTQAVELHSTAFSFVKFQNKFTQ